MIFYQMPDRGSSKVGWSVEQWSHDTSICRASVWTLISSQKIKSVKHGARRIILTTPDEYLTSLAAEEAA